MLLPSPRLLARCFAALACALAATGSGLTLNSVLSEESPWWDWTRGLDHLVSPLVLVAVFGGALIAAWTRRGTSFVVLCAVPAFAQLVFYVTSLGYPEGHGTTGFLYRYPLASMSLSAPDGGVTWDEGTTMSAIGLGVVAALAGVWAKDARRRPRLLVVAPPALVVLAVVARVVGRALSEPHGKEGWWGIWQYVGLALVAFTLGAALILLSRVRRAPATSRVLGALLLLVPLAVQTWDARPVFVRRALGERTGSSGGSGFGFVGPLGDWSGLADLLSSLGEAVLKVAFVLAALAAVACVWPRRREDEG